MKNLSIKISSVTYALKAKSVLAQKGIQSAVKKHTHPLKNEGCGYSLFVPHAQEDVLHILEEAHIPFGETLWLK